MHGHPDDLSQGKSLVGFIVSELRCGAVGALGNKEGMDDIESCAQRPSNNRAFTIHAVSVTHMPDSQH